MKRHHQTKNRGQFERRGGVGHNAVERKVEERLGAPFALARLPFLLLIENSFFPESNPRIHSLRVALGFAHLLERIHTRAIQQAEVAGVFLTWHMRE